MPHYCFRSSNSHGFVPPSYLTRPLSQFDKLNPNICPFVKLLRMLCLALLYDPTDHELQLLVYIKEWTIAVSELVSFLSGSSIA